MNAAYYVGMENAFYDDLIGPSAVDLKDFVSGIFLVL